MNRSTHASDISLENKDWALKQIEETKKWYNYVVLHKSHLSMC
jgi:hypothetical protein